MLSSELNKSDWWLSSFSQFMGDTALQHTYCDRPQKDLLFEHKKRQVKVTVTL